MAGFFSKLKEGLSKTRDNMIRGLDNVFKGYSNIDDEFYEEIEETLIMGDVGIAATSKIMDNLRLKVKEQNIREASACRSILMEDILYQIKTADDEYEFLNNSTVIFVIVVN